MGDRKQGVGDREQRTGNTSFISSLPTTRSLCDRLRSSFPVLSTPVSCALSAP